MENLDLAVLRALRDWRLAGRRAMLVTIVTTWGSSPRPVGSIMALDEGGRVVGSVSGGCIEDDLIHRYTRAYALSGAGSFVKDALIPEGPPLMCKYGVSADEAHRFGLPCGGTIELLLEFDPSALALKELVEQLEHGKLVRRRVRLSDGLVQLCPAIAGKALICDAECMENTFGPEYRMLIIGAGQLSQYLSTMAVFSGFSVVICDPREEYRSSWTNGNVTFSSEMPDDVVREFRPDRRSCIVALTHDPKLDDLALIEALETEAFYVGAIGSRRNNQIRRERLGQYFEISDRQLARLHGPIGLFIGSKTPAEIAISVMAEIVAIKNGVCIPGDMQVSVAKERLEPLLGVNS